MDARKLRASFCRLRWRLSPGSCGSAPARTAARTREDLTAVKTKQKNVLVALGWYDHRLIQGISAYATQHGWHLAAHSIIHEKVIPWGWQGDGVLAWLAAGDDLAQFVASVKKPTVDFSLRRAHLPFARVVQDHGKVGQLAAGHFL